MKQANKKGFNNKIGAIGEQIAANHYATKGFSGIETNYLKKWGEIDIVARGTGRFHFIEVKTVSYETKAQLTWALSHETWRPEDNVHRAKLERLYRAIQSWIIERRYDGEWQIDVVVVRLVPREKYATIKIIDNVIA